MPNALEGVKVLDMQPRYRDYHRQRGHTVGESRYLRRVSPVERLRPQQIPDAVDHDAAPHYAEYLPRRQRNDVPHAPVARSGVRGVRR